MHSLTHRPIHGRLPCPVHRPVYSPVTNRFEAAPWLCSNQGMRPFSPNPLNQQPAPISVKRLPWRQALGLWIIIALCCLVELSLWAADHGWIGQAHWRSLLLQNGAFWTGLLHNWRPNYAAQPWSMFLTYGFLHADIWHLVGNMLVLAILGHMIVQRIGQGLFLLLYIVSALVGALAFALLTQSSQPMVGASGALFGLIGALQAWQWRTLSRSGQSHWPVIKMALWLVVLNAAMWLVQKGGLAWQTHLGGYIGGVLAGWLIARWRSPEGL